MAPRGRATQPLRDTRETNQAKQPALLITFANSLDPDQARQNVGPDRYPNCLTL